MKRKLTVISIILCVLLSLCSCSAEIQKLKADVAHYTDDSRQTINFRENEYQLVLSNTNLEFATVYGGTVTDKDVPVLIAEFNGNDFKYDEKERIIVVDTTEGYYVYARDYFKSSFEELVKSPAANMTNYCIFEYTLTDGNGYEKVTLLDGIKQYAIEQTLSGPPENPDYMPETYYIAEINRCDPSLILTESAFQIVSTNSGALYLDCGYGIYKVPDEHYNTINSISESDKYGY